MSDILTTPLLTARETARHLKMPESTLDAWLADRSGTPLVHAVDPARRGGPRVPFVGIIEAYVLRSLRELGFGMLDIRRAADLVRREFADPYALAKERIATDGVGLFVRVADESLVHARDSQIAISEVISRYLTYITWDSNGNPAQLRLPQYPSEAEVIIDPRFGWGAPVLATSKVPIDALLLLWQAGESISAVAEEYDLSEDVSRMSSDRPLPEFFFDRSLGKAAARRLARRGWIIHLIADFYDDDAAETSDATWIAEGCARGWILLTKDKRIRYRANELGALERGHLFCLASGNLGLDDMAERFIQAQPAMLRAANTYAVGFLACAGRRSDQQDVAHLGGWRTLAARIKSSLAGK